MYNEEVEKRMQEKKFDYQKLFLYLWILAVLIGFTALMVNNSNYEVVMIDETGFLLPNRMFEGMERTEGEGFSFSKSGECLVLGVESECTGIDAAILEQFNITEENLKRAPNIKYAYELKDLAGIGNGVVLDYGKTGKPSYDKFFLKYRADDREEIFLLYRGKERTALGIVIVPTGEFSDKEIEAMYGSIG